VLELAQRPIAGMRWEQEFQLSVSLLARGPPRLDPPIQPHSFRPPQASGLSVMQARVIAQRLTDRRRNLSASPRGSASTGEDLKMMALPRTTSACMVVGHQPLEIRALRPVRPGRHIDGVSSEANQNSLYHLFDARGAMATILCSVAE
jgi:hypothetical protein